MTDRQLFDAGLQPERTALAWRRTLLTLAVAWLVALRLLPPVLGTWTLGLEVAGLAVTVALWLLARRRERRTREVLLAGRGALPGGGLLVAVAVVVTIGGALGLLGLVLLRW